MIGGERFVVLPDRISGLLEKGWVKGYNSALFFVVNSIGRARSEDVCCSGLLKGR